MTKASSDRNPEVFGFELLNGGVLGARAAYIGGAAATSLVIADMK